MKISNHQGYFKAIKIFLFLFIYQLTLGLMLANAITFDPDDYRQGANLSTISPFVTLTTSEGSPVYCTRVYSSPNLPDGVNSTGLLGSNAFSANKDYNGEWIGSPLSGGLYTGGALVITFAQPVTYVSILNAEISMDAGPFFDDPAVMWVFNSSGNIVYYSPNTKPIDYNGTKDNQLAFPVYLNEYSGKDISRVVISGSSEPTTLDRLTFTLAQPVPEPSAFLLVGAGICGLCLLRTRNSS